MPTITSNPFPCLVCRCRPVVEQVPESEFVPCRNRWFYHRLFNSKTLEVTTVGAPPAGGVPPNPKPPKPARAPRQKKAKVASAPAAAAGANPVTPPAASEAVAMEVDAGVDAVAEEAAPADSGAVPQVAHGESPAPAAESGRKARRNKVDDAMHRIVSLEQTVSLLSSQMMLVQDLLARVSRLEQAGAAPSPDGVDPLDS